MIWDFSVRIRHFTSKHLIAFSGPPYADFPFPRRNVLLPWAQGIAWEGPSRGGAVAAHSGNAVCPGCASVPFSPPFNRL